jgi:hypothetical protein
MPATANPSARRNDIGGLILSALVPVAGPFLVVTRLAGDAKRGMDARRRSERMKAWLLGTMAALGQALVVALILRLANLG